MIRITLSCDEEGCPEVQTFYAKAEWSPERIVRESRKAGWTVFAVRDREDQVLQCRCPSCNSRVRERSKALRNERLRLVEPSKRCPRFSPSGKPDVCGQCAQPYLSHPGTSAGDR